MVDKSELLRVPAFENLPEDQIEWFLSQSEELLYKVADITRGKVIPRMQCLWCLKGKLKAEES